MNDAGTTHEIVTDVTRFRELQTEWDALWSRAHGAHHQSFAHCWTAWEHLARPAGRKLRIVVRREAGNAVLIFPLVVYRRWLWTFVQPLTALSPGPTDMLVVADAHASLRIEDAWHVVRKRCQADFIHMPYVRDASALERLIARQRYFVMRETSRRYFVKLADAARHDDWPRLCESLGAGRSLRPGDAEARLAQAGKVRIEQVDWRDPERIVAAIDAMLGWKRANGEHATRYATKHPTRHATRHALERAVRPQHYRNYLIAYLINNGVGVMGHALIVSVDGKMVAVLLMCSGNRTVSAIASDADPAFAKWSPAQVANDAMLEWAFEQRLDVDFGAEADADNDADIDADCDTSMPSWSRNAFESCTTSLSVNSSSGFAALCARRGPRNAVRRLHALFGHDAKPLDASLADRAGAGQDVDAAASPDSFKQDVEQDDEHDERDNEQDNQQNNERDKRVIS